MSFYRREQWSKTQKMLKTKNRLIMVNFLLLGGLLAVYFVMGKVIETKKVFSLSDLKMNLIRSEGNVKIHLKGFGRVKRISLRWEIPDLEVGKEYVFNTVNREVVWTTAVPQVKNTRIVITARVWPLGDSAPLVIVRELDHE